MLDNARVTFLQVLYRNNNYLTFLGDTKVPVLFFIHPGAFFSGSNQDAMHHAETLVHEHDFIVVEPNYRLGPSGFWYNPNAAQDEYETNWGLLDQRLALEWVRF